MGIWKLKATVQKGISFLPFKHRVNYLFQKHVTKGLSLTNELFEDRLTHAQEHWRNYAKYSGKEGFSSLELGTGWYPIVPIALYLCGANRMVSIDISDLLESHAIKATIQKFLDYHNTNRLAAFVPALPERIAFLETLLTKEGTPNQLLAHINCEALLVDARKTPFESASFDLIHSNNTFEHVFPDVLKDILIEFNRLLKPDGISTHFIDLSDHFAHLDKSITVYNYLKFTPHQWGLIDNSIQPQNRWRINQYRELIGETGFDILEEENRVGLISDLDKVKLAAPFNEFRKEDLLVTHSLVVLKKKA